MKVHDLKDKEGRVFAFEISNLLLSRRKICKLIQSIPEMKILKKPNFRSRHEEEFCEFEIQGQKFVAWEPFGDNDHYWIGPKSTVWCEQVEIVRNAFINHKRFGLLRK
jgi:hypothetical protein